MTEYQTDDNAETYRVQVYKLKQQLDFQTERYDNLHKQFGNALVEATQCKRLYERYKDLLEFYLERTEFTTDEHLHHEKLMKAYAEIKNLERANEVLQDVVVKLTNR